MTRTRLYSSIVAILVSLLSMFPAPATAEEVCHGGVCFPGTTEIAGVDVPVRGIGLLRYWGFRVYTVALYVEDEHTGIESVLGDVPRKLILHYHRSISNEDIAKATREMISRNPRNNVSELEERVRRVCDAYESVGDGDRYEITYVPTKGTSIALNGEHQLTVEGEDFARAFFGIWLSEESVSNRLRDDLLGIR